MAIEKDIVLIYYEDNPLSFARIESIAPDVKPDWYHVKLLILKVPLQAVTWLLRDAYINGDEFTMGGKKMRLEKIDSPREEIMDSNDEKSIQKENANDAKIISLSDLKKE